MDLIYTNANMVDQGVLSAYAFDLSFGAKENDFEMTLGATEPALEFGAIVYMEGTEYGGIVDTRKKSTDGETITYIGRTWHGMINSKVIQPDTGEDYLVVSGDANEVLATLIARLGLSGLFTADSTAAGINIKNHQFKRYCKGYDGIRDMLEDYNAKLIVAWKDRSVVLSAVPVVDYTQEPIDGDVATLTVEQHGNKVNHLICLGRGELAEREVIHLYADAFGQIVTTPYFTGLAEYAEVYDYSSVESSEELRKSGIKEFKSIRSVDSADIAALEKHTFAYDIGDIVGAVDIDSGMSVSEKVTQKIVKIKNGAVSTDYQTGG